MQDDSEKRPCKLRIRIQNWPLYVLLLLFIGSVSLNIFQFLGQQAIHEVSQSPSKTPFGRYKLITFAS